MFQFYNIKIDYIYIIMTKLLVLYVFHIYNDMVKNFINNCIYNDDDVDFIIISNNKDNTIEIPDIYNNVKTLFRDNIGYDFGGWSDALLLNDLYKNYDNFIFVNSSVIGPFLPSDFKGKWTDFYINGLEKNVKLFGSTINTLNNPLTSAHVQSYIFSMDITTLKYLIKCDIFSISNYVSTFHDAIHNKEILMSRKIIENNWNIGSLFQGYKGVDFTFKNKTPEESYITFVNDIMFPQFRNVLWTDYELVFIKGNRINIDITN